MSNINRKKENVLYYNLIFAAGAVLVSTTAFAQQQPELTVRSKQVIEVDGLHFKDLNGNSQLDVYEDWRKSADSRAADLLTQMTLKEKAGLMMHGTAPSLGEGATLGRGSQYDLDGVRSLINGAEVRAFITRMSGPADQFAEQNNHIQEIAEASRLGIPATISTDPRNSFQYVLGATVESGGFSKWPETLGLAAIGDAGLMREFADVVRQEYLAVGIRQALSPQIDLASEPRWPRVTGTFGENPTLSKVMAEAYVDGFQHGKTGLSPQSVNAVAKHWVGYGAASDEGFDSHNSYGKHASFGGSDFDEHLIPFEGAFDAKVAGIMPTYSILDGVAIDGRPLEAVAAGFNKQLLTDLLRGRFHFEGVVLSDWLITNDCKDACLDGEKPGVNPIIRPDTFGMPWGVEDMSRVDRFVKAVNAGVDQFGGVANSDLLVDAVNSGKLSEARVDESAKRILVQKFEQGLFENAYVDPEIAMKIVGNPDFLAAAEKAQAHAMVLLKNEGNMLPTEAGKKVYLYGVNADTAKAHGFDVVSTPEAADFALVRLKAPSEKLHPNYFFGVRHEEGDLSFKDGDPDYEAVKSITSKVPTVVTVYLSRPAILTNVSNKATVLIGNFGASDDALFNVLLGQEKPLGRLPFELPSSMEAVRKQSPSKPHDSENPLYPIGFSAAK